jgi:peptide/nickel transport system ATP-binding protein
MPKKTKDTHVISGSESRAIAKSNTKEIRRLEKQRKRRNVPTEEYTVTMHDPDNIVEFDNLQTYFFTDAGVVKSVDGVSFSVPRGSVVGVVGESGCGKSVTSLSLMRLIQAPHGQITGGEIRFAASDGNAYNIPKVPFRKMNQFRGKEISMILQEPMTSLNPVFTIGNQLDEVSRLHEKMDKAGAKAKSMEMLNLVGIAMPERVYGSYPHELSGGMRQRVMIAMALACNPQLLIADEPTTALDVTIQAQILELLQGIKTKMNGSIMLITHDLGVIAEMANYVVVMYAGRIVEKGTAEEIFDRPLHPYTVGLQRSKPVLGTHAKVLYNIPGNVPNPIHMPEWCYFRARCQRRFGACACYPKMVDVTPTHSVACHLYDKGEGDDE